MKIKATCSFCGAYSMNVGDVGDVPDDLAKDLIAAGYAAAQKDPPPLIQKKAGAASEKKEAPAKKSRKKTAE